MTRTEVIRELRECERRIADLNTNYQLGKGLKPSQADPALCFRRNELRRMLIERVYEHCKRCGMALDADGRCPSSTPHADE